MAKQDDRSMMNLVCTREKTGNIMDTWSYRGQDLTHADE